jgi:hypothetical protein
MTDNSDLNVEVLGDAFGTDWVLSMMLGDEIPHAHNPAVIQCVAYAGGPSVARADVRFHHVYGELRPDLRKTFFQNPVRGKFPWEKVTWLKAVPRWGHCG